MAAVVVVAELPETGISERLPAEWAVATAVAEVTAVMATAQVEAATAATVAAEAMAEPLITTLEEERNTVDLKAAEVAVLPPIVGGRALPSTTEGIIQFDRSSVSLGRLFRYPYCSISSLSRFFILSSVFVSISLSVFFFQICQWRVLQQPRIARSNVYIHRELDFCTVKISVEHGMGGFRRFLQWVSTWVY
jgi:hypothetical protein